MMLPGETTTTHYYYIAKTPKVRYLFSHLSRSGTVACDIPFNSSNPSLNPCRSHLFSPLPFIPPLVPDYDTPYTDYSNTNLQ